MAASDPAPSPEDPMDETGNLNLDPALPLEVRFEKLRDFARRLQKENQAMRNSISDSVARVQKAVSGKD